MDFMTENALNKLKIYMGGQRLSQKEMAKMLAVSENTLTNWMKGKTKISPENARLIDAITAEYKPDMSFFNNSGQGATIIGKAGTITYGRGAKPDAMPAPVLEEKAIRLEERKRILDKLMALDSIPAEVKIIIYNELIRRTKIIITLSQEQTIKGQGDVEIKTALNVRIIHYYSTLRNGKYFKIVLFLLIVILLAIYGAALWYAGYRYGVIRKEVKVYYISSKGIRHKATCIYFKRHTPRDCKVCGGSAE